MLQSSSEAIYSAFSWTGKYVSVLKPFKVFAFFLFSLFLSPSLSALSCSECFLNALLFSTGSLLLCVLLIIYERHYWRMWSNHYLLIYWWFYNTINSISHGREEKLHSWCSCFGFTRNVISAPILRRGIVFPVEVQQNLAKHFQAWIILFKKHNEAFWSYVCW